jgi:hypothetical protein
MKKAEEVILVRTIEDIGEPNDEAAIGNPLRGLAGGSRWAAVPLPESIVPFTIEWCNIGVRLLALVPESSLGIIIGHAHKQETNVALSLSFARPCCTYSDEGGDEGFQCL